jgi:hypothetical protein
LKKFENQGFYDSLYAGGGFIVGASIVILVVKALRW